MINRGYIIFCAVFAVLILSCGLESKKRQSDSSNSILCKNSSDVLKIAEDTLVSLYGNDIKNQKPFKIELSNDSLWIISGTQDTSVLGGGAYIEIQKSDCKVLNITHGK